MLQSRLSSSLLATSRDASTSLNTLAAALSSLTLCSKHSHLRLNTPGAFISVRHASHAAQGRANGPKDSAGRRLGAKKTASEYVIPGNIIFRQRGTKWYAGENADIGKDHTIYATVAGYVRYYRNPSVHPKRRYIGVALEKEGPGSQLPTPINAPTRRRLGMHAAPIREESDAEFLETHLSSNSKGERSRSDVVEVSDAPRPKSRSVADDRRIVAGIPLRPGTFWPSNYDIGRVAETKGIKVREFDRKDRWMAWRKRAKRVKEGMLAKAAKANRKTKGKKSNKGAKIGNR